MSFVEGLTPDTGKVLIGHPSEGILTARNAHQLKMDWTLSHYVPPGKGYIVDTDRLKLDDNGFLVAKDEDDDGPGYEEREQ